MKSFYKKHFKNQSKHSNIKLKYKHTDIHTLKKFNKIAIIQTEQITCVCVLGGAVNEWGKQVYSKPGVK